LKDWLESSSTVGPRHTAVLSHVVMAPKGAGDCEGVTVLERVVEAVRVGLVLGVAEKDCVVDAVGDCVGVAVALGV